MAKLFVITGQTATSKTAHAIRLAQEHNGEIISADSRQVYRGMNVITGKDREEYEKKNIIVHMLDVITPNDRFSSFDYVQAARKHILAILEREKTPIVVGGTYLYIKHLIDGMDSISNPNLSLRAELEKLPISELQKKIEEASVTSGIKPDMNNSDWNNPRRLIRRIENLETKKTQDSIPPLTKVISNIEISFIGFKHKDKNHLIDAITKRAENRLKQGAVEEVMSLLKQGYAKSCPGLQAIGYKQLIDHLDGKISLDQAKDVWITKEVQYAKRQYTFMKVDERIEWRVV